MKKNEFYRESTGGSRIKNTARKIVKNVGKTIVDPLGIYPKIGKKIRTGFKKPSSFKMKGFSGFGNSPAKQKFDPYKKDNEAYNKAQKKSDDLAKKINKTYLEGGGAYDDPSSKTGKLMTQWKQGLKSLEKQEKDITRKNESFNAYMKKVKSIKQKPSKRGKIKPTPKAKPTTTQKIKKFLGLSSPLNDTVKNYKATKKADYKKHRGIMKEKYAAQDKGDPLTANIMDTYSKKVRGSKRFKKYSAIGEGLFDTMPYGKDPFKKKAPAKMKRKK